MEKIKANLFVYGNIIADGDIACFPTSDVQGDANPDNYDLSSAVIINGDLKCREIITYPGAIVACTNNPYSYGAPEHHNS